MTRREQFDDIKDAVTVETLEQYTYQDYRVYEAESGKVYASVTTVLDEIKADPFLQIWKDTNGSEAVNQVLRRAADSGTKVHNTIEEMCIAYQSGIIEEVYLLDEWGKPRFSEDEWCGVIRFIDFFDNFIEEIIYTEQRLFSDRYNVAGTVDMVARLYDGRVALIDHKFANHLSPKYSVQTFIYADMLEERTGLRVDVRANLWLKAQTRGRDKTNKKIQGEGWSLIEHNEDERDKIVWEAAHTLFFDRYRTKPLKPLHRIYPSKLSLK